MHDQKMTRLFAALAPWMAALLVSSGETANVIAVAGCGFSCFPHISLDDSTGLLCCLFLRTIQIGTGTPVTP